MPRRKNINGTKDAPKKAPAKSHTLAKPLPLGTKLVDSKKTEWLLGGQIGQGGFGLIYAARRADDSEERYVVKIEPKSNGPLFCEFHFYRNIKLDQVPEWKKKKNLKSLGIPTDVSSGSYVDGSTEYRFLVMERYGEDLQKLFERNGKRFPATTALSVALKVIDALEYIHHMGYVHADIKAANLLLGLPPYENEVFLVDFGLAFRFSRDGVAAPYKEDPKRRHDGTLEFCARDAHRGANPAPRGDFETLAYCVLQWIGGQLPWNPLLGDSKQAMEAVFQKKENCMKDPKERKALAASCDAAGMPDFIKFLDAVADLSYEEKIDYDRMRGFLQCALRRLGANAKTVKLTFASTQSNNASKTAARKRPQINVEANGKSPASRAKSPVSRAKSPASKAKSPVSRAKSPASKTKSSVSRAKSPASKAKALVSRAKSPASKTKALVSRAKSSASRAKSPAVASPASRTASPSPTSPGPSSQKRQKMSSPASVGRTTASQTSPGLLKTYIEQRKRQKQQQKS